MESFLSFHLCVGSRGLTQVSSFYQGVNSFLTTEPLPQMYVNFYLHCFQQNKHKLRKTEKEFLQMRGSKKGMPYNCIF